MSTTQNMKSTNMANARARCIDAANSINALSMNSSEFNVTCNDNYLTATMIDFELEEYMALVASKIDQLGVHYVNRQIEWAEDQLRQRGVV